MIPNMIQLLVEIQNNDEIKAHEPYVEALSEAIEKLDSKPDPWRDPRIVYLPDTEVTPKPEPELKRRAWEVLLARISSNRGEPIVIENCFEIARDFMSVCEAYRDARS